MLLQKVLYKDDSQQSERFYFPMKKTAYICTNMAIGTYIRPYSHLQYAPQWYSYLQTHIEVTDVKKKETSLYACSCANYIKII